VRGNGRRRLISINGSLLHPPTHPLKDDGKHVQFAVVEAKNHNKKRGLGTGTQETREQGGERASGTESKKVLISRKVGREDKCDQCVFFMPGVRRWDKIKSGGTEVERDLLEKSLLRRSRDW